MEQSLTTATNSSMNMANGAALHTAANGGTSQQGSGAFEESCNARQSHRFVVAAPSHVAPTSASLYSTSTHDEKAGRSSRSQNRFHCEAPGGFGRTSPAICSPGRSLVEHFGDARPGSLPAPRRAWLTGVAIGLWNRNTSLIDWARPSWRKCIGRWFLKYENTKKLSI